MRLIQSVRASTTGSSKGLSTPVPDHSTDCPFKVGDEVVVYDVLGMKTTAHTLGDIGIIAKIDGNRSCLLDNKLWYNAKALRHAKYKPAVGDVVEFEDNGETFQGIVFHHETGPYTIAVNGGIGVDLPSPLVFKKIGHTATMDGIRRWENARPIAKAYFSDKPASYADRQAAWVKKFDIKEGSKVKVVRKFKDDEDGYDGLGSSRHPEKGRMVGKAYEVVEIRSQAIAVYGWEFPYFVLEPQ